MVHSLNSLRISFDFPSEKEKESPHFIKIFAGTAQWWLSGLEHQSHDNLGMFKVEGANHTTSTFGRMVHLVVIMD